MTPSLHGMPVGCLDLQHKAFQQQQQYWQKEQQQCYSGFDQFVPVYAATIGPPVPASLTGLAVLLPLQ